MEAVAALVAGRGLLLVLRVDPHQGGVHVEDDLGGCASGGPHLLACDGPSEAEPAQHPVVDGIQQFRNYRIRTLLYCGRPNWSLLATITPR